MSKPYCGLGDVPKGKERGSAEDCLEANQVRYYGVEKFDKKLLDSFVKESKSKTGKAGVDKALIKLKKLEFQLTSLKKKYDKEKDKDKKDKIKVEFKKKKEAYIKQESEHNKLKNAYQKKVEKAKKTVAKKPSKKASVKKTSKAKKTVKKTK